MVVYTDEDVRSFHNIIKKLDDLNDTKYQERHRDVSGVPIFVIPASISFKRIRLQDELKDILNRGLVLSSIKDYEKYEQEV